MTDTAVDTLALKELDQAAVTAWSEALGDPAWLRARRLEAFAAFEKLEQPTNREEAWRFTDPRRGSGLARHRILRSGGRQVAGQEGVLGGRDEQEVQPGGVVTVVDGGATGATLAPDLAARGVLLTDLATAAREHADLVEPRLLTSAARFDEDWFLALHASLVSGGAFLYVPRGVEVEVPVGALYRRAAPGATFAHTLVVVEDEASLTFVQEHGSPPDLGGRGFHHGVTELFVGQRASVQHLALQEWGSEQVNHFNLTRTVVGRQARYRSFVVTLGGGVVRVSPETRMYEGAEADFLGAAFADAGQRFEHRATTHHVEPHGRSQLLYKGGLLGGARNVFYGNILIYPGARGSDAGQTMRNLVLSRHANAEAIPFLEIENSDVKCSHAAATGRVDDEHLFYLQSRGVPREEARRLVVFGFFDEVLAQVSLPAIRHRLEAALEAELAVATREGDA